MNKTKKVLIVTLSLVAILSIFLTYKAYMNKPVMLDDIKYSENTINKKKFGIFVEKSSYSSEQDKYEIYSGTTWPSSGYEFNSTLSTCVDENGETISNALSINNSTITLTSTKTAYCYLYFDIPSTPFVNIGTDSTTGLPVVKIGNTEEFYDITNAIDYSSLDSTFLTKINYDSSKSILLAKYNLYVGQNCTSLTSCTPISTSASGYGLQSVDAKGYLGNWDNPAVGVVPFSGSNNTYGYWDPSNSGINSTYGTYTNYANNIYDTDYVTAPNYSAAFSNSAGNVNYSVAYYVEEYVNRLGIDGTGRLLTYPEANAMTQTQRTNGAYYWLGSAGNNNNVWYVTSVGFMYYYYFNYAYSGVRPVVVVSTSDIGA